MDKLIFVITGLLILMAIYKVFTYYLFLKLRNRLKDGNIDTFTSILGENYQYRFLKDGLMRYKWSKRWMIVRANFDITGKLICSKIMPNILFRLKSEMIFVG